MRRKKIGVALCSGGARGFANIGVLKELADNGIKIDYVAGTSMGAVVGSLFCAGYTPDQIIDIAISKEWTKHLDFVVPDKGLIARHPIEGYFRKVLKRKHFRNLAIPLRTIATDIEDGTKVVLSKGDVAKAVYSSMAIPGIFEPGTYYKKKYSDGGILDPLPVEECRKMGADIVIAVDLSHSPDEFRLERGNLFGVMWDSNFIKEMERKLVESQNRFIKEYLKDFKGVPGFAKTHIETIVDRFFNPEKIISKRYYQYAPVITDILMRSIYLMMNQVIVHEVRSIKDDSVIIVHPDLKGQSIMGVDMTQFSIDQGRKSLRKNLSKILKISGHTR